MSGSERFIVCDANGRFGCVDTELKKTAWAGTDKRLAEVIREESANGMAGSWAWVNEMPVESPAVETTEASKSQKIRDEARAALEKVNSGLCDEPQHTPSRYHRTINGATLDLYDVAEAYGLESHRIFHAVKKLVMAGRRGHKDREQDLREAIVSIESELQKMKGGAS